MPQRTGARIKGVAAKTTLNTLYRQESGPQMYPLAEYTRCVLPSGARALEADCAETMQPNGGIVEDLID